MKVTRRELAGLTASAFLAATVKSNAAELDTITSGEAITQNLDPHQVLDILMLNYTLNSYDGLFRYQGNPPVQVPWLAESATSSEDGLQWTVKLRQGAKFHDGSDVTADDVVYSFQRLLTIGKAPSGPFASVLKPQNVTSVAANEVKFILNKPYAPFFAALPVVAIINSKLVKQHEVNGDWGSAWLAANEAGSGAFQLVSDGYQSQEKIDLVRFDGHFMGWKDLAKPVKYFKTRSAKETSTRILGLLNGSLDFTDTNLGADQLDRIKTSKIAHVQRDIAMRTFLITINNSRAPFTNINVRKALAHAFNYDGYIEAIMKGNAKRNGAPMPAALWGVPKDIQPYDYNLDKAKEYLAKAKSEGVTVDRPIEFYTYAISELSVSTGQVYQSDLAQIGITLKLVNSQWANILSMAANPATAPDMWPHWVSAYFIDPENWVGAMYDSKAHGNWRAASYYKNADVDNFLDAARATSKQAERQVLYEKAIRQIVADCPDIWIYDGIDLRGVSNRVEGFKYCPVGAGMEVRSISTTA